MKEMLHSGLYSSRFIHQSKSLAYFFITFLVALIQALEDLADRDDSVIKALGQFVVIAIILSIAFPFFGKLSRWGWRKWSQMSLLKNWKYKAVSFVVIGIIGFPLALVVLAYVTNVVETADNIWAAGVTALIFISIVGAIEIFWFMLENRQHLELTNERLLRNQEMAKYQALMNQLNPHFLFNSLNVLSYLVYKDQRGAEQFIEELSKIYRYIIQLNETYLVPLKREMEFIDSYMYLQRIRHRNNLTYEAEVDANAFQKYIPPLTLEVLLENAIKHNIIDAEKPLHIKLSSQNGHLIVENNVQPRTENEVQSTHVGLKNLSEKFYILDSEPPEFYIKDGRFIAKIPLLLSEI